MTWTYELQDGGGQLVIYDHTDTAVSTVDNDGSGFDIHQHVMDVMEVEVNSEFQANGFSERVFHIFRDAIFADIEER
ncbi:hypothetical protein HFTV1-gp43 [Haloferax tailed virus 1]|uniref:Uncharacterized protein n=1 Tax=Haloferax tailed virus 1 TaxID=2507575 RepID=A0A410N6T0_HFTV1|nr:hypothetical protein M1M17_gp43 [Haloferax tailed virus 1]QAS68876.1 hypothetical protein HFTV1-gp43 [Haloferax tailed virus 1]